MYYLFNLLLCVSILLWLKSMNKSENKLLLGSNPFNKSVQQESKFIINILINYMVYKKLNFFLFQKSYL